MSGGGQDGRLRAALQEAHADEQPPGFEAMCRPLVDRRAAAARGERRALPGLLVPAGALAALAIALTICMDGRGRDPVDTPVNIAYSGSDWTAPTDFLLDAPGMDWLGSIPSFGVEVDVPLATQPDPEGSTP